MVSTGESAARSAPAGVAQSDRCPATLANRLATDDRARQLITVVSANAHLAKASLTAWRRTQGCWLRFAGPYMAWIGRAGMRSAKREGDGSTPEGVYQFSSTMYGNAPDPGLRYRYRRIGCGDWWDEDVASPEYDTFRAVPCTVVPSFANGASEALWKETGAYPYFAVIAYNPEHIPGLGSGIFLHASLGVPTSGCISVIRSHLVLLLRWLDPSRHPAIVIGTVRTIASY